MRLDDRRALVQTVDFFPPIVDDPRWFGRIAAANSLSDVYAMGGRPVTALNIVCWPSELDVEILGEILAGGLEKVREAGAILCGGHSVTDKEIKFGMAVTGLVPPGAFWPNSGARAGDRLILTKPIGMGPTATAIKKGKVGAERALRAMEQMAALNKAACEAVRGLDVHAATDVTGFGLIGHAFEMAEGAGLGLRIEAGTIPVFEGALDLVRAGILSGGCKRGRAFYGARVAVAGGVDPSLADAAFDAETSGGLLLALGEDRTEEALRLLREAGVAAARAVGAFLPRDDGCPVIELA
ncbi:MAG: selenide, water dikinase SelD [Planctomycetota bacterium]